MEPMRNTETEGSSGRPVMTDKQNESGAKSVLPQATGTNKRVLHGSIILDKPNDASLESEVLFHKEAGSQGTRSLAIQRGLQGLTPDQNPREYSPVASASRRRKNRVELYRERRRYALLEVKDMTDNYAKKIGEGRSGTVYHGNLLTGREVAVKVWAGGRTYHSAPKEFEQFQRNYHKYKLCEYVVQMIGYCNTRFKDGQISIYEYMPGGTLQQHLHDKGVLDSETHALDGKTRLQIALHIAQGIQHFPGLGFELRSNDIFLTENWVPKVYFHRATTCSSIWLKNLALHNFGVFLWELISRQPQAEHGERSHLVKAILEDSDNMENINPTLGLNFPTETIIKIVRIIHFCLQPNDHQPAMSYVIDEINGALQLEEGLKAEEGIMKIEIPPHASCASIETLEEIEWPPIFDEKSTSDCSEIGQKRSTVALVDINPKGERQQQPQTIFTQSHGSRSSKGDSICSSSDDEMPATSKKESLSPQPELFGTITSIEGVPNLPTMRRSSVMVASRKNSEGNVELLFKDAENMTQVVGVGLEWAKVVVTKELDVEVREIGEHAWKGLWEDQGCEELELLEIVLPEPETKVGGSLNTGLEDELERFGIGLTKSDVIGVYAENHLEQLNEGFFPLVYDLVEYMGLEGENSSRYRQVSGGEGGSSKGAAKVRCSTEKSGGSKDVHQDPSQDPPEDGSQDGFQGPPQGPSEPLVTSPLDMEGKKVLLVSIFPLWGYLSHGPGGQEIHDGHGLYKATIVPVLKFMFEVDGGHRKITTTLILTCDLGEGGGPNVNPGNLGYFQDNITISLHCEMDRAATLFSRRVENVEIVKRTTTTNASNSYKWGCKGEILVPFLGIQAGGGDGQTTERGSSFADEMSVPQLSSFYVTSKCRGSSLVYNFLYPEEVQARITDDKKGPRELITSAIGGTFEPTIVGEWDGLDQSKKCNYIFKTERDIISIEGLRQSHGSGQEPECIKQRYELPLWVNHSMTHILHRHEIKELRAPKVNILKHVIGAKPALCA